MGSYWVSFLNISLQYLKTVVGHKNKQIAENVEAVSETIQHCWWEDESFRIGLWQCSKREEKRFSTGTSGLLDIEE